MTTQLLLEVLERIGCELHLTPGELAEIQLRFPEAFTRRLPEFAAALAVESALPSLGERFYHDYRAKGLQPADARNESQTAVAKILAAYFGRWPRTRLGAWVNRIRDNALCDYGRKRGREQRCQGASAQVLSGIPDPRPHGSDLDLWDHLTDRLAPLERAILFMREQGATREEIARRVGLSLDRVRAVLDRVKTLLVG
ncbi:rna polymerase sigma factor : : Sigma70_r4_2 [Gemmata massiliana]|uniref:Rna polymerase sigma factor:: Sigma70_r4_2 n=1 Tax=Gemmata massiliana TaxID=1210884 RepID=A0A6P2D0A7_9BACT|nr:hypothetical protein [Gemmata massiliana]VTR92890.1 rna polymerase sigma factor : : Sigma70_r4_2 [Gemmata massiliana]